MQTIIIGFVISFLGQLPLGAINLTAIRITVEEKLLKAMSFALGIVVVEMCYLLLILMSWHMVLSHPAFLKFAQILSIIVLLLLAHHSFKKKSKARKESEENHRSIFSKNKFWYGVLLSSINIAQLPFWLIWSNYVMSLHVFTPNYLNFLLFAVGTSVGSLAALCIYMVGGTALVQKFKEGTKHLNTLVAVFFLLAAIIQIYGLL